MARYIIIVVLCSGLVLIGCNKNQEEVDALSQEAAQDDAGAVMDSLEGTGAGEEIDTLAEVTAAETSEAPEEPSSAPDYSSLSGFVVQVGSYSTYEFAQMMADKYIGRDYPAFVVSANIDGITYYRLRIGVYETMEEAKEVGELVADRYTADYWIDNN
ncbi:MAG: SPOR domain-containing protein [candidate division Zixibacteria bacterium]